MAIEMIEEFDQGTRIKVIGVGGGGGNAVAHMIDNGVQGVEFIVANTDAQALNRSAAGTLVQLGNKGLGAGGKPEVGRALAEEAVDRIREAIDGAHMLFITAGMGGGTGTGAASTVARVAREMGILTVGVVTKPFDFEGQRRRRQADQGVAELEANVDSLIVILNEKLLEVLGDDVTQEAAFAQANDVLRNAVGGISDIIHMDALVNVDFEDVKTVMSEPGKAMMGTGSAVGPDRAKKAAEAAVACPLLEGIDLSGARGVLVLIAASRGSLKLRESQIAMDTIRLYAAEDATIIFGAAFDESLGDKIRVTVIATGLGAAAARRAPAELTVVTPVTPAPQPQPVARTGTYDAAPMGPASAAQLGTLAGAGLGQAASAAPMGGAATPTDYGGLQVPSVWRSARTKVEALSGTGMDEIEIPAFLRKQAD